MVPDNLVRHFAEVVDSLEAHLLVKEPGEPNAPLSPAAEILDTCPAAPMVRGRTKHSHGLPVLTANESPMGASPECKTLAQVLSRLFEVVDCDNDGVMSADELAAVLPALRRHHNGT